MNYLIKIIPDEGEPKDVYLRRFESDDISLPIRVIDDALSRKPKKPRADKGKPRATAEPQ